jgi:hypothetical protein
MRIEYVRGRDDHISPSGSLPPMPAPVATPIRRKDHLRLLTIALIVFTLFIFVVLKLELVSESEGVRGLF